MRPVFLSESVSKFPITFAVTKEGNDVLTADCQAAVTSLDICTWPIV